MKRNDLPPLPRKDCSEYEQDLLLYVHNALASRTRRRVESHVRRCSDCRRRLAHFVRASETLAGAVRGDQLPAWRPANASPYRITGGIPWYLGLVVALLVTSASLLYLQDGFVAWMAARQAPPYNGFAEKVLTHNRSLGTPGCAEKK